MDSLSQKCICGKNILVTGMDFAILHFNDGTTGILKILNCFDLSKEVTQVKDMKRYKSWLCERGSL